MGKHFEVIAAESNHKEQVKKFLAEATQVFDKKNAAYTGHSKTYTPLKEGDTDIPPPEYKPVGYTVKQKCEYLGEAISKLLDCRIQIETGNTKAKADLIVTMDDEKTVTLAKDVPVTFLLGLEKQLEELRKVYDGIPTLDPNFKWTWNQEQGAFEAPETYKFKTKQVKRAIVGVHATDKHPAQVQFYDDVENVGKYLEVQRSGAMPVSVKHKTLKRLDQLIRGVTQARQRANDIPAESVKIGRSLIDFLHADLG